MPKGSNNPNTPKRLREAPPSSPDIDVLKPTEDPEPYLELVPDKDKIARCESEEMNRVNASLIAKLLSKSGGHGVSVTELCKLSDGVTRLESAIRANDSHVGLAVVADLKQTLADLQEAAATVHGAKPARNRVSTTPQGDKSVH